MQSMYSNRNTYIEQSIKINIRADLEVLSLVPSLVRTGAEAAPGINEFLIFTTV